MPWLPRWLFRLSLGVSVLLVGLVVGAPWLDGGGSQPDGWSRAVALFARDATLRRTALACAAGLTVTAFVFFQADEPVRAAPRKEKKAPKPPPSQNVAGA